MEDKTKFAPALRSTEKQILAEKEFVVSQKLFAEIFGAMSGISAVIDNNRQIVYANNEFMELLGIKSLDPVLGQRPGEAVSCIHSAEQPSGCGTSEACAYCGAVNAIIESQRTGLKATKECRISTLAGDKLKSWDLKVTSSPMILSGNLYYIFSIQDISSEKRRSALERTFLHDLLNSAGGLNGLLTILKEGCTPEESPELISLSEEASRDILDEIMLHRQIRAAENGELQVKIETVNSREMLDSTVGKISSHEAGLNKKVIIDEKSADIDFETDKTLLRRVLINLIKNALEATEQNGTVIAGVNADSNQICFRVKNDGIMPMDVQMQLFQRSFSTKGQSRGIGTYSIKLLAENYLKAKVSFVSNESMKTEFYVALNKVFPKD